MNTQEIIERDVRMALGDLTLQLIMARARVQELEAERSGDRAARKPNGQHAPETQPEA